MIVCLHVIRLQALLWATRQTSTRSAMLAGSFRTERHDLLHQKTDAVYKAKNMDVWTCLCEHVDTEEVQRRSDSQNMLNEFHKQHPNFVLTDLLQMPSVKDRRRGRMSEVNCLISLAEAPRNRRPISSRDQSPSCRRSLTHRHEPLARCHYNPRRFPEYTAALSVQEVVRLHGLPSEIISDRGPQFVSPFWKQICIRLGIQAAILTAFHPETDGQTENANAQIEQVLRMYCNYMQNDWSSHVAMCEFSINNWKSSSTGVSPFLANYGQHPRMGFEFSTLTTSSQRVRMDQKSADKFVDKMTGIQKYVHGQLVYASDLQKEFADRSATTSFKPGDLVYLRSRLVPVGYQPGQSTTPPDAAHNTTLENMLDNSIPNAKRVKMSLVCSNLDLATNSATPQSSWHAVAVF